MMKIEIICGTYGYRPEGSKHPIPIDRGGICEVSEEEAQRLFARVSPARLRKRPLPLLQRPLLARTAAGLALTHLTATRAQRTQKAPILTPSSLKR